MSACNRSQSTLKCYCKLVKALAPGACSPRDGINCRQDVIDAMLKLVTEHFLPERPLRQFSLDPYSVDSRSQQVGVVLKKIDIVLLEFPELPRVNLQHTEWAVLAANNNIDGAPDAMLDQELGNFEPNLPLGIFGNHRLVRVQGIASRRALMRGYFSMPYHAGVPVHPGADEQILAAWDELHAANTMDWQVGRPYLHDERGEWEQYAYDPLEKPMFGERSPEWIAVGQTEVA